MPAQKLFAQTIISIHALREEGDPLLLFLGAVVQQISIHALREEGDYAFPNIVIVYDLFLSTPSARRATCCNSRTLPRC